MGNIVSVFVSLYGRDEIKIKTLEPAVDDIFQLLFFTFGSSYWVPTWFELDETRNRLNLQYGAKWGAYPDDVWDKYSSQLKALWVRSNNEDGSVDQIYHLNESMTWSGEARPRDCVYTFDEVRLTWLPDQASPPLPDGWQADGRGWRIARPGTYLAYNDRSDVLADALDQLSIPTPTTPTYCGPFHYDLDWQDRQMPPFLTALEPTIQAQAAEVDFWWQGRLVGHQERREVEGQIYWYNFSMDDWDNCTDQEWRTFNEI